MIQIAKYKNKIYQVHRITKTVAFSQEKGWVLLVSPINNLTALNLTMKWVRTTDRFDWVRTFHFGDPDGKPTI